MFCIIICFFLAFSAAKSRGPNSRTACGGPCTNDRRIIASFRLHGHAAFVFDNYIILFTVITLESRTRLERELLELSSSMTADYRPIRYTDCRQYRNCVITAVRCASRPFLSSRNKSPARLISNYSLPVNEGEVEE